MKGKVRVYESIFSFKGGGGGSWRDKIDIIKYFSR